MSAFAPPLGRPGGGEQARLPSGRSLCSLRTSGTVVQRGCALHDKSASNRRFSQKTLTMAWRSDGSNNDRQDIEPSPVLPTLPTPNWAIPWVHKASSLDGSEKPGFAKSVAWLFDIPEKICYNFPKKRNRCHVNGAYKGEGL